MVDPIEENALIDIINMPESPSDATIIARLRKERDDAIRRARKAEKANELRILAEKEKENAAKQRREEEEYRRANERAVQRAGHRENLLDDLQREIKGCKKRENYYRQERKTIQEQNEKAVDDIEKKLKAMNIMTNYRLKFKVSKELSDQKLEHPDAVFIQVLGNTGVGKSSLLNTLLKRNVFETDHVESTLRTQFVDVTDDIEDMMQFNNCAYNSQPRVFFCDQPGIGGNQISSSDYFETYTPGHYDFSIVCTGKRLTENEKFIMKHLTEYGKDFMVVRTCVDAILMETLEGGRCRLDGHQEFEQMFAKVKDEFQAYIEKHICQPMTCMYSGHPIQTYDPNHEIQSTLAKRIESLQRQAR